MGTAAGITPDRNITTQYLQALNLLFLSLGGVILTGNLTAQNLIATAVLKAPQYQLDTAAGVARYFAALTGGVRRWTQEMANSAAEMGANSGSNWSLTRYTDAGVAIDAPLVINRATGQALLTAMPALTGGLKLLDGSLTNPGYVKLKIGLASAHHSMDTFDGCSRSE